MPNAAFWSDPPFKRWGYFPIDHEGPNGKLSVMEAAALKGYDRVLAYGIWGSAVISNTLGWEDTEWIPHGINMDIFRPRDGNAVRTGFGFKKNELVVGCVMTNQWRKDWALACQVIQRLSQVEDNVRGWFKVDSIDRYWDLRALVTDFGLGDVVVVDIGTYTDEEMAYFYSLCNVTMLPSLGEGFGYPIVESLACGVPVVHGSYGGGAELLPTPDWMVEPMAFRFDTRYNCLRPVYGAMDWVEAILKVLDQKREPDMCRNSVSHLDWKNLHIVWKKWFLRGVDNG
jgi:glycosyltransferase involved in cell wall biosynthesis